jgi:DNA-binding CsgD family transcriptional regulator
MLIAARGGKIQFAEPTARRWLKQFFSRPARVGVLPSRVLRWVSKHDAMDRGRSLVAQTTRARLYLKREQSYTDNSLVVLFELIRGKIEERSRRHRQLTPRELEVLFWLARGKSNAEIGAILLIASATVNKHLERIYPKLGVENRVAAASSFQLEERSNNTE